MSQDYENKTEDLISLHEASKLTGYHQDYLGSLCRSGKLQGLKIGRNWVVSKQTLDEFLKPQDSRPDEPVPFLEEVLNTSEANVEQILHIASVAAADVESKLTTLRSKAAYTKTRDLETILLPAVQEKLERLEQAFKNIEIQPDVWQSEALNKVEVPTTHVIALTPWMQRALVGMGLALLFFLASNADIAEKFIGRNNTDKTISYALNKSNVPITFNATLGPGDSEEGTHGSSGVRGKVLGQQIVFNSRNGVVSLDEDILDRRILFNLQGVVDAGWIKGVKGEKGDRGDAGSSGGSSPSFYAEPSYAPIQYIQPQTQNNFNGASLFSATEVNAHHLIAEKTFTLKPGGVATFNGRADFLGGVSVGAVGPPVASAVLQVTSTTQGFLPPRLTTAEKAAIGNPATGLVLYDSTLNKLNADRRPNGIDGTFILRCSLAINSDHHHSG